MPEDISSATVSESDNEAVEIFAQSPTPAIKSDANAQAIEEYLKKLQALCPSGRCGDN